MTRKRLRRTALLGLFALLAGSPAAAGAEADEPWGAAIDGLACRIRVPKETCVGETVPVAVEVKNVSAETRYLVAVFDILFPKHARLDIVGPIGPFPAPGTRSERGLMPDSLKPIQPNEVLRFEFTNLSDYFFAYDPQTQEPLSRFDKPGEYRLTYSFFGIRPPRPQKLQIGQWSVDGMIETRVATLPEEKVAKIWAGTLVSNTASFTLRELRGDEFQAHEWGVFTIYNDQKFANADRKAEWASVPDFFYRQFPTQRLRWEPAMWKKPILFFYCTRPTLRVGVKLTFADGAPVVWWPCAARPIDRGGIPGHVQEGNPVPIFRTLEWSAWLGDRVPMGPALPSGGKAWLAVAETDLPAGSWLRQARLKGASLVSVTGTKTAATRPWSSQVTETERFIYYDGLVPAPNFLRCVQASERSITVKNSAGFPLQDLFLIDRRAAERGGPVRFAHLGTPIAPGKEQVVDLADAPQNTWPKTVVEDIRKALASTGLTEAEAASILSIWDQGFFHAPGVTAFYLLPQSEYDRMLPLEILPRPKRVIRVGIALHPQFAIEPELAQRVDRLLARLDVPEAAQRDAAAKELSQIGPLARRAIREALKKAPSPEAARQMNEILKSADATDWLRQAMKTYDF